eukprot:scaffold1628_cov407-Prasinococcus_capsulatus_cf.AAC.29
MMLAHFDPPSGNTMADIPTAVQLLESLRGPFITACRSSWPILYIHGIHNACLTSDLSARDSQTEKVNHYMEQPWNALKAPPSESLSFRPFNVSELVPVPVEDGRF